MVMTNAYGNTAVLGLSIGLPSLLPLPGPTCCVTFLETLLRRCISLLLTPYTKALDTVVVVAAIVILPMLCELRAVI